jgi:hypothetical protein
MVTENVKSEGSKMLFLIYHMCDKCPQVCHIVAGQCSVINVF